MTKRLTIDVKRRDGEITHLEGEAGLAVMMQSEIPVDELGSLEAIRHYLTDLPTVSLRTDNAAQLAFLLAGLIGSVRVLAGQEVVDVALSLSSIVAIGPDSLFHELPDDRPNQG